LRKYLWKRGQGEEHGSGCENDVFDDTAASGYNGTIARPIEVHTSGHTEDNAATETQPDQRTPRRS